MRWLTRRQQSVQCHRRNSSLRRALSLSIFTSSAIIAQIVYVFAVTADQSHFVGRPRRGPYLSRRRGIDDLQPDLISASMSFAKWGHSGARRGDANELSAFSAPVEVRVTQIALGRGRHEASGCVVALEAGCAQSRERRPRPFYPYREGPCCGVDAFPDTMGSEP